MAAQGRYSRRFEDILGGNDGEYVAQCALVMFEALGGGNLKHTNKKAKTFLTQAKRRVDNYSVAYNGSVITQDNMEKLAPWFSAPASGTVHLVAAHKDPTAEALKCGCNGTVPGCLSRPLFAPSQHLAELIACAEAFPEAKMGGKQLLQQVRPGDGGSL